MLGFFPLSSAFSSQEDAASIVNQRRRGIKIELNNAQGVATCVRVKVSSSNHHAYLPIVATISFLLRVFRGGWLCFAGSHFLSTSQQGWRELWPEE